MVACRNTYSHMAVLVAKKRLDAYKGVGIPECMVYQLRSQSCLEVCFAQDRIAVARKKCRVSLVLLHVFAHEFVCVPLFFSYIYIYI